MGTVRRGAGRRAVRIVGTDLLARARAGDDDAFRRLTEPHRRELHVHCYRMLGSFQDAEDAVQETLLSAWRSLDGFEGSSSLRTWLYRIATNRCLNVRRTASRRPVKAWDVPGVEPPAPTRLGEVPWLEPYPDALLDGVLGAPLGPEARYDQQESISLAFVTALQVLPSRQVAVLVLRDVLGFPARDVAEMLDVSVDSVNSALKRARAGLRQGSGPSGGADAGLAAVPETRAEVVTRFVRAWESADLEGLIALLADDVLISMPPLPFEYEGRDVARRFFASIFTSGRRFELIATAANGQPAFGAYLRSPTGASQAVGLYVLDVANAHIRGMTRFESATLGGFGLPERLERR